MAFRIKLYCNPAVPALLVLGLLCWVVALGGIAACTKYCYGLFGVSECGRLYQVQWWSIWFEFFLLIIMLGTCFLQAFDRGRLIFLMYLTMVTILLTITARDFITDSFQNFDGTISVKDYKQDARNAAGIGAILLCIVNYLLIIFIGLIRSEGGGGSGTTYASGYGGSLPEQKYQPATF